MSVYERKFESQATSGNPTLRQLTLSIGQNVIAGRRHNQEGYSNFNKLTDAEITMQN